MSSLNQDLVTPEFDHVHKKLSQTIKVREIIRLVQDFQDLLQGDGCTIDYKSIDWGEWGDFPLLPL